MRLVILDGEQVIRSIGVSEGYYGHVGGGIVLPIYSKAIEIEFWLRKASMVYSFQPIFVAVHAEQVGCKSNCGTFLQVKLIDSVIFLLCPFYPVDPDGTESA